MRQENPLFGSPVSSFCGLYDFTIHFFIMIKCPLYGHTLTFIETPSGLVGGLEVDIIQTAFMHGLKHFPDQHRADAAVAVVGSHSKGTEPAGIAVHLALQITDYGVLIKTERKRLWSPP